MRSPLAFLSLALCFGVAAVSPAGATAVDAVRNSKDSSVIAAGSGSLPYTFQLMKRPAPRRDPMRIWNRLTPSIPARSHVAVDSELLLFASSHVVSTAQALRGTSLVDSDFGHLDPVETHYASLEAAPAS